MDREQMHSLIEQVAAEVDRRLARRNGGQGRSSAHIVLLPAPAAFPEELGRCLAERYGGWIMADFSGTMQNALPPEQLERGCLLALASQAETVALAAPSVALLREIAAGEDGTDLAFLVIRAILWGKKVELLLDFDPPRFHRNSLLGQVADALETLASMNVETVNYHRVQQYERLTLVTEEAVRQAARTVDKTVWCSAGAIITPSARDALNETGVRLRY